MKKSPWLFGGEMNCSYSNTIAVKYGINAALITGYIREKINDTDFIVADAPWVRLTIKEITGAFPFMGEKAVRNATRRLKKGNILVFKKYGKEHFDHANYYTITAHGYAVMKGDENVK